MPCCVFVESERVGAHNKSPCQHSGFERAGPPIMRSRTQNRTEQNSGSVAEFELHYNISTGRRVCVIDADEASFGPFFSNLQSVVSF